MRHAQYALFPLHRLPERQAEIPQAGVFGSITVPLTTFRWLSPVRSVYKAILSRKTLLSARAQCFHLEFAVQSPGRFEFQPGQFITALVGTEEGKQESRAYSIACAPRANEFDLCVNRVGDGVFSNRLCDLEPGQPMEFHGPHGFFLLRNPPRDAIFAAAGTGIAPVRGFVQQLFPEGEEAPSGGREFWLVYGGRDETELYYDGDFERVAARHGNFHYLKTLSQPSPAWMGARGEVQDLVLRVAEEYAAKSRLMQENGEFNVNAYVCGLHGMVSATRQALMSLGWQRKQIIFERYD